MRRRDTDGPRALWSAASIGTILVVFVLLRLPLLTKAAAVRGWNGDSSIFGLMARKIHDGRGFDVFYWGQNYMGSLTPALAAAIRRAALDPAGVGAEGGPLSLRLAALSEVALGISFYVLGLSRLFGLAVAGIVGLLMAIGPPFFIRLSAVPFGTEMSFAIGSVLFFLAAGALTRQRPFLDRAGGRFVFGTLAGLGWWCNQTIVFVLVPVAALVLLRSGPFRASVAAEAGGARSWRGWPSFAAPLVSGVALGYFPVWMGRLLGWYEPALGPVVPPWRTSGIFDRAVSFLGTDAWRLIGLEGLLPPPLLAAAALALLILLFISYRRRSGSSLRTLPPTFDGLDLAVAILALGAAVFLARAVHPTQLRFLAPVLPAALAVFLAGSAEAARVVARRVPQPVVALLFGGIAAWVGFFLVRQARGAVAEILREPDPRAPLEAIAAGGYSICHAGYDAAYTLQFLSDEKVRFIPFHSPDRNRALSATLRAMPGPQCLVTDDGTVRPWLPSDAAQEGGPALRRAGLSLQR